MSLLHLGFGRIHHREEVIGLFDPATITVRPTHFRQSGGDPKPLGTQGAPRGRKVQSWVLTSTRLIASPIRTATLKQRMEATVPDLAKEVVWIRACL